MLLHLLTLDLAWTLQTLSGELYLGETGSVLSRRQQTGLTTLTLAAVFHLPLRQTVGFLRSILTLMKLDLPVPDYTTLCRRRAHLDVHLAVHKRSVNAPLHVVVDSTGLKVYG